MSLVRSYADGRTDDEAFKAAIGMDVAAFNDAWLADLGAKEPVEVRAEAGARRARCRRLGGCRGADGRARRIGDAPAPARRRPARPSRAPCRCRRSGCWLAAHPRRQRRWRSSSWSRTPGALRMTVDDAPASARSRAGRSPSVPRCSGLGFLVAAQLAAEGPRVRYTTQERSPLVETATQLQQRQDELKARILDLRERIQATEQAGEGSAELVRQLNDQLQEARIAAGLIPLTGTGIVLQLEDSQEPVAPGRRPGRLPRRGARPALHRRGAVGGRRRGGRGQRRTHHADERGHRRRPIDPRERGLSRRPVPGHGPRPGGPVLAPERVARVRRPHPGARRRGSASRSRSPSPRSSTCRRSPAP